MNHRELQPVLRRLEERFASPETRRFNKIQNLIEDFSKNNYSVHLRQTYQEAQEKPGRVEDFRDTMTAFLFFKNRERYQKENYDLDKEARQIFAVIDLLDGNHIHMGTGEGKSTTVLPIAAIVDAMTSDKRKSNLVTTDEALMSELKENAGYFQGVLAKALGDNSLVLESPSIDEGGQLIPESLKKRLIADSITGEGTRNLELSSAIQKQFWEKELKSKNVKKPEEKAEKDNVPTVAFATDRDIVFRYQEDPKEFAKQTGNIYFDEADAPYKRRSSYVRVTDEEFFTPEEARESTASWLARYIVSQHLDDSSFTVDKTGYTLTEEATKAVEAIDLNKIADDDAFQKGVNIIAKKLELSGEKKEIMAAHLAQQLSEVKEGQLVFDMSNIGEQMAGLHKTKGVRYDLETDELGNVKPQVRDSYIDQFLSHHKFDWEDRLNILAQEGIFDFVSLHPVAFKSTSLQTFIFKNADKIRAASGTLLYPDPDSGKVVASPFGSFLRDATGREIAGGEQPEIKEPPAPKVLETEEEVINEMVTSIPEKPTLIVSYQIEESRKIYQQLVKKYGDKVAYVETKPSKTEELIEYQNRVKKIYQDLAEGKIQVVVSSGAAGFGVNIVKNDGSFPDLHIMIHDLPANRAQLMQILGRRRASGSDFSWFISHEFLRPYIALFDEKVTQFAHALGMIDILEIDKKLAQSEKDPKTTKKIIMEILRKAEAADVQQDDFTLLFEEFTALKEKDLQAYIGKEITKLKPDYFEKKFLEKEIGLPDNLRRFMLDYLPLLPMTDRGGGPRGLINGLSRYLEKEELLSDFFKYWFTRRKETVLNSLSTITEGGQVVGHDPNPIDRRDTVMFTELEKDEREGGVTWGVAKLARGVEGRIVFADVLSYTRGNKVYLIFDKFGRNLIVSNLEEAKTLADKAVSGENYNIFWKGYSFWYNKSNL